MAVTPNALVAANFGDLVQTTLKELGRGRFTEIVTPLQEHVAMRNLLQENKIQVESGYSIQWDVMVLPANEAYNVGLGASDNVNIPDTMTQATVDWRNTTVSYAYEHRELDMNASPSKIVDLILTRRIGALISMAELMEANFWGPPVNVNDNLTPWGVNTWFPKNATQGFNGGVPSGYTTIGGLSPTTYPNWNSWTDTYTTVSADDLIRKMRRAAEFTKFTPPVDGIPSFDTGEKYGIYTNYGVIQPIEEQLIAQNDNIGHDVAAMDGRSLFRRVPFTWVPYLERDTTNPVYGIDWGVFKTAVLKGWWLKETFIPIYPGQHTMSAMFSDCTYQWLCRNRRNNWVISNGTTYPN